MFAIPPRESKSFLQPNLGDTKGNLWSTFQVDTTTNMGRVRNMRSVRVMDGQEIEDSQGVDIDPAMAYAWFDYYGDNRTRFLAYCGVVCIADNPVSSYSADNGTNHPNYTSSAIGNGDMTTFDGNLYVTTQSQLKWIAPGGTWTTISSPSIGSGIHTLCPYGDRLYVVADGATKIYSMNTAQTLVSSGSYTLDLSFFDGHISWIRAGSNRIWIGFTKNDGTRGLVFEWDGQSENLWSKNYAIEAQGSCGCAIWNDIPYILDTEGRLLGFNGSNFQEVARLPFIVNSGLPSRYIVDEGTKLIHFNGITYSNDRILINISSGIASSITYNGQNQTVFDNLPSGVWEYTKENGLIHLVSSSLNEYGDTEERDYGQIERTIAGAIYDATSVDETLPEMLANFIFSTRSYNTDGSNNSWGLYVDDIVGDLKKSGNIVSAWMEAEQVSDVWKSIIVKYKKLLDTSDKIIVKYRTINKATIPNIGNVNWSSATTFTSTEANLADAEVGDEVTIVSGLGGGDCAHITSITNNAGTYTVVVDKSMIGVTTGTINDIIINNWTKLREIPGTRSQQFENCPFVFENKDVHLQVKIVMEWTGDNELYEMIVVNDTEQHAK